jgi:hypothetical protein
VQRKNNLVAKPEPNKKNAADRKPPGEAWLLMDSHLPGGFRRLIFSVRRRMATIRVRLDSEDQMKRVTGTKV